MLERWAMYSLIKEIPHKTILARESIFKHQRRMKKVIADDGLILYLKRG